MPFDYSFYIDEILQLGDDGCSSDLAMFAASGANLAIGTNPPYALNDFLATYPRFGGTPLSITGTLDGTTNVITSVSSVAGIAIGQLVAGAGIPSGSLVVAVGQNTITISQNTTAAQNGESFSVFTAPLIPMVVLQMYINLATASLMQARWCDMWQMAMALYIAHFAQLWLQTESGPSGSSAQAGLAQGVKVSKSVGDVSVGYKPIEMPGWEAFSLTQYGIQFAQFARLIGAGGMLLV